MSDSDDRELISYIRSDWKPRIVPAPRRREWMDKTRNEFAYRCLPLAMANANGWQFLSPRSFEAVWDGGESTESIKIRALDAPTENESQHLPISIFGYGILTFHVESVLRTPQGWNIWISGPPNSPKDGITALCGLVETDWAPMSFTMNWKFTRPGLSVKFDKDEPFCFFFPVKRGDVESFNPRMVKYESNPEEFRSYTDWSKSRDKFINTRDGKSPNEWQKHYFQGTDASGNPGAPDHQTKLKVKSFEDSQK